MQVWRSLSDITNVHIVDITVRRSPECDVALPMRAPIADTLTEQEAHALLHAFGADGDPIRAGYRDYFYTDRNDPVLCSLTEKRLFAPMPGDQFGKNMTYFVLTKEGKHTALSMTPEYANA
jgi:hypothetical protein